MSPVGAMRRSVTTDVRWNDEHDDDDDDEENDSDNVKLLDDSIHPSSTKSSDGLVALGYCSIAK